MPQAYINSNNFNTSDGHTNNPKNNIFVYDKAAPKTFQH